MAASEALTDDPFAVFDGDEDGENASKNGNDNETRQEQEPIVRDPSCGVLVFRQGTEQALLAYVRNQIKLTDDEPKRRETILKAVDDFCLSRHWMMHVGPKKGSILTDFLLTRYREYQQQQQQIKGRDVDKSVGVEENDKKEPFRIIEVGTYCGYSTILMAHAILQQDPKAVLQIVTVDVDPFHQDVARALIQAAGLSDYVHLVGLRLNQRKPLTTAVQSHFSTTTPGSTKPVATAADFVFLDHVKDMYLLDLQELEGSGLIREGTAVAADNVVFHGLEDYRRYMQSHAQAGVVRSELILSQLEYVTTEADGGDDFTDGLELTVYLQTPTTVDRKPR